MAHTVFHTGDKDVSYLHLRLAPPALVRFQACDAHLLDQMWVFEPGGKRQQPPRHGSHGAVHVIVQKHKAAPAEADGGRRGRLGVEVHDGAVVVLLRDTKSRRSVG